MKIYWTNEKINFLKNKTKTLSWQDLTKQFNEAFNENAKTSTLRWKCKEENIQKTFIKKTAYNKIFFTPEETKWLIDNYKKYNYHDKCLSNDFYKKFNKKVSNTTLLSYLKKQGYYYNLISIKRLSSPQKEYLAKNWNKYNLKDLCEMFNEKFGLQLTVKSLRWIGYKLGFKRSKTAHMKANSDAHSNSLGSVRIKHNNVFIKVKNDIYEGNGSNKNWKQVSLNKYLYEKHFNVKLKDDEYIIALDGNLNNRDFENNLVKVNRDIQLRLGSLNAYGKKNITRAMISILKTEQLIKEKYK